MRYIAFVALMLALAACGSSAKTAAAPASSSAVSSATTSAAVGSITCADIDPDPNTVVSDLKERTQSFRKHGSVAATARTSRRSSVIRTGLAALTKWTPMRPHSTAMPAHTFRTTVRSSRLGWETDFDQVTNDINALAKDCGQPTAPPNSPSSP